MIKRMITFFTLLCGAYLMILVAMFVFQRNLMYLPGKEINAPQIYGLGGFSDVSIKSADGILLQLWVRPAAIHFPTIIYFHGNAANLANRAGIYAALANKGFGVIALSYRGYGKSAGSPSEQGIYDDARAAIAYATQQKNIPLSQIILYGESLGSGVAVQMANEYPVAAVVLQSPYTSVATRAAEIYSFLPVQWLIKDRFDSIDKIASIKAPLLVFHGERDRTIPVAHGRAIFEKAAVPKQAYYFPDVDHMDFDPGVLAGHVLDFYLAQSKRQP